QSTTAPAGEWSDQETLRLLEALEMYGESWKEVSQHVQTKSPHECVLQFLRLPIEDPYLEDQLADFVNLSERDAGEGMQLNGLRKKKKQLPQPYAMTNPLSSTLALLASMVDPEVAARATQAAWEALTGKKSSEEEAMSMQDMETDLSRRGET